MFFSELPLNFNIDFFSGFNFFTPTFSVWQNQPSVFSMWNNNFSDFNFNNSSIWNTTFSSINSTSYTKQPSKPKQTIKPQQTLNVQRYKIGNFDLDFWKSKGYDHSKGQELALDAAQVKKGIPGQCVGYTRKTINRVYGTNFTNAGAAEKFGTTILSQPQLKDKFKKANMKDIEKGGIPDGAIVLWKAGSPGFTKSKAALYGHGGICYQGKVYSNYVETKHLDTCAEIWIPVKA